MSDIETLVRHVRRQIRQLDPLARLLALEGRSPQRLRYELQTSLAHYQGEGSVAEILERVTRDQQDARDHCCPFCLHRESVANPVHGSCTRCSALYARSGADLAHVLLARLDRATVARILPRLDELVRLPSNGRFVWIAAATTKGQGGERPVQPAGPADSGTTGHFLAPVIEAAGQSRLPGCSDCRFALSLANLEDFLAEPGLFCSRPHDLLYLSELLGPDAGVEDGSGLAWPSALAQLKNSLLRGLLGAPVAERAPEVYVPDQGSFHGPLCPGYAPDTERLERQGLRLGPAQPLIFGLANAARHRIKRSARIQQQLLIQALARVRLARSQPCYAPLFAGSLSLPDLEGEAGRLLWQLLAELPAPIWGDPPSWPGPLAMLLPMSDTCRAQVLVRLRPSLNRSLQ